MNVEGLDVTAIIVAVITSATSIATAIMVTHKSGEGGQGRRYPAVVSPVLLVLLVGAAGLALAGFLALGLPALAAALACLGLGVVQGDEPPLEEPRGALGGLRALYFASTILLIASLAVVAVRNPGVVTIVSLICAVAGSVLLTRATYAGSLNRLFVVLFVISFVLIVGAVAAVVGEALTSEEKGGAEAGAIQGSVLDADSGSPVVGAIVTVREEGRQETADGSGRYEIAGLPSGTYTVEASAEGYTTVSQDLEVRAGDTTTLDFRLIKEAEDRVGVLQGNVYDETGKEPISGARVSVRENGRQTITDGRGAYEIASLPAGRYTVEASADGYVAASQAVVVYVDSTATLDFRLSPQTPERTVGDIRGRVYDRNSGSAIANATVAVPQNGLTAVTDSGGNYEFVGLTPGTYTVEATAEGYDESSVSVEVTAGGVRNLDFRLYPLIE